mmetsp:Transcript_38210/g.100088  ORF Transcript_38210/g.100088 Transcript_38210/m.100088 type:complete len:322 (-) Transcript_38210:497-1462(-)
MRVDQPPRLVGPPDDFVLMVILPELPVRHILVDVAQLVGEHVRLVDVRGHHPLQLPAHVPHELPAHLLTKLLRIIDQKHRKHHPTRLWRLATRLETPESEPPPARELGPGEGKLLLRALTAAHRPTLVCSVDDHGGGITLAEEFSIGLHVLLGEGHGTLAPATAEGVGAVLAVLLRDPVLGHSVWRGPDYRFDGRVASLLPQDRGQDQKIRRSARILPKHQRRPHVSVVVGVRTRGPFQQRRTQDETLPPRRAEQLELVVVVLLPKSSGAGVAELEVRGVARCDHGPEAVGFPIGFGVADVVQVLVLHVACCFQGEHLNVR